MKWSRWPEALIDRCSMGLNTMEFSSFWTAAKSGHEYMGNSGQGQKESSFAGSGLNFAAAKTISNTLTSTSGTFRGSLRKRAFFLFWSLRLIRAQIKLYFGHEKRCRFYLNGIWGAFIGILPRLCLHRNSWGTFGVLSLRHGWKYWTYFNHWIPGAIMICVEIRGKVWNIHILVKNDFLHSNPGFGTKRWGSSSVTSVVWSGTLNPWFISGTAVIIKKSTPDWSWQATIPKPEAIQQDQP